MMYLHDVWVNWFEGEENGYNVCHFHEWRKEDGIELLDQVPLLYVTEVLFHYIENDLQELPKSLLENVYQRAYLRRNQERVPIDYAFVATDGISIIAVDTMGYSVPIRKSRLIPRQERLVYDMINKLEPTSFSFTPPQKEYHPLSLPPEQMVGLTRKERQLKQILMMIIDQLKQTAHVAELRYWLTEWAPGNYEKIQQMEFEEVWQKLYDGFKDGWSSDHEEICRKMVRGQPFFEKLWELEQGHISSSNPSSNQAYN
ncbi:YjbA family protein [Salirhabdus salicampi]|uniref:YjbA family protein n=1 Tax=Salirhabdus salicampi TaxID=476102 RepID=UPI0020C21F45|nr:YjbA family protein [Salirhabdus salicampi]MCP8615571.1 YjbA family protein [Salirhabdus salicampi]